MDLKEDNCKTLNIVFFYIIFVQYNIELDNY